MADPAAARAGEISVSFENRIAEFVEPRRFVMWRSGRLYDWTGKEMLLFHYVNNKHHAAFHVPAWPRMPETVYITETGMYRESEFRSPVIGAHVQYRRLRGHSRRLLKFVRRFAVKRVPDA